MVKVAFLCNQPVRLLAPATLLALGLLGGCAAPPIRAPAPSPQLVDAGPLELPRDCAAARGAVYRTRFVVQTDGRVTEAASESGTGCVQDALRNWVATFVYRPTDAPTALAIDWMDVVASHGS